MHHFLLIALVFVTSTAMPAEVAGTARVLDGDTIKLDTVTVRLHGIDAPENGQDCTRSNGKSYNCGAASERHLKSLTLGAVVCTGNQFDSYGRLIGVCRVNGVDINSAMVRSGWALAFRKFSTDYVHGEAKAKVAGRGLWSGSFVAPWEYRAARWESASQSSPDEDCPIKGNINRKGDRIYHAPWSRSYNRTRINEQKGERWFCSEAEALAAGWRAPSR